MHDLNRQVITELVVEPSGKIKGILLYIIRVLIVNAEMDKHYIRIRK